MGNIAINGFGRIGRSILRIIIENNSPFNVVAINDLGNYENLAYLLKHDSVMGVLDADVSVEGNKLKVNERTIELVSIKSPKDLPWKEHNVDVVIESTGIFRDNESLNKHIEAGAKKVIISAPASCDATFVVGVNDDDYDPKKHHIISNASCTTNCFVPMIKVLDDAFGVQEGLMTTTHAYTGDQAIVDGPHSDLRRARAAAVNIIPTSTGAARATGLVLKKMQGKLDGIAMRVPIPDGSVTDFTGIMKKMPSVEAVNEAFKEAARRGPLKNVLEYSEEPLVSADIVGSPASCTFDAGLTMTQGKLVKICGWYDNEWGYSNRLIDLTQIVGTRKTKKARR